MLGASVILLVGEVFGASQGPNLPTPRVADLDASVGPPDAPVVRVVWLGDSTAAGVGASRPDTSLPRQVADVVVAGAGGTAPRLQVTVLAESGARVDDILATQLSHLRAADPDVVVISVGANDTIHATRRPTFRSRYRRVLEGVRAAGVKADRIVMIGVPDMASPRRLAQPLRSVVGWRSRQLDLDVRHLARAETTHYVDLFAATSQPFRRDPHRYFAADRYHPNDTGYHLWAQAIAPGVRAALAAVAARA